MVNFLVVKNLTTKLWIREKDRQPLCSYNSKVHCVGGEESRCVVCRRGEYTAKGRRSRKERPQTHVIIAKSEQRTQQKIENTTLLDNRQGLNLRAQSRKMLLAQVEPDIRNVHKHVVAHWTNIKLQIRKEFCDRRRQRGLILFNKTFSSQRHFKTIVIYWHSTFWQEYNFRFTAFHVLLARRVKPLSLYRTKMTLPIEYLPVVSRTGSFSVHVKALY